MSEPCTRSHDNGCQAFATYEVQGSLTVQCCGTHLTRVVQDYAVGNNGQVVVKVLREK